MSVESKKWRDLYEALAAKYDAEVRESSKDYDEAMDRIAQLEAALKEAHDLLTEWNYGNCPGTQTEMWLNANGLFDGKEMR